MDINKIEEFDKLREELDNLNESLEKMDDEIGDLIFDGECILKEDEIIKYRLENDFINFKNVTKLRINERINIIKAEIKKL